jgi:uncharacterized membrane protein
MLETILQALKGLPKEWVVLIVSALPVAELRLAIPLGLSFGMSLEKVFVLSVIGNIIPIAPILFLLDPVSQRLRRFKIWARFFEWLFARTKKRAQTVQKYEALGLALFVAIPLPVTGAWTGSVAASLFKIRFRYAFIAAVAGVICAGVIVSLLSTLGIITWNAVAR